jgi:hypothetical protein
LLLLETSAASEASRQSAGPRASAHARRSCAKRSSDCKNRPRAKTERSSSIDRRDLNGVLGCHSGTLDFGLKVPDLAPWPRSSTQDKKVRAKANRQADAGLNTASDSRLCGGEGRRKEDSTGTYPARTHGDGTGEGYQRNTNRPQPAPQPRQHRKKPGKRVRPTF